MVRLSGPSETTLILSLLALLFMHVIIVHVDAMNSDIIFGIVMYNIDMLITLVSVCWTHPLVDVIHIFAYIAKMIDFILYDLLVGCTHIIRKYVDFNNSALC